MAIPNKDKSEPQSAAVKMNKSIPFIDLKRFEPGFKKDVKARFSKIINTAQFIGGREVLELESRLQEMLSVRHAITCANGTDALQLALRALNIGRGDLVILPNSTFWATFEAVVNVGADPMTIDISPVDSAVDHQLLESAILNFKPKAIILVHLYGFGSEKLQEIRAICTKYKIPLLEDGAQSFGTIYKNKSIYTDALISTTSFYPAKVLGGSGDGGAVFTNNTILAEKVRSLSNHGRKAHYEYNDAGWNSRLDALQAAFLNISLNYISQRISSRRETALQYKKELEKIDIKILSASDDYIDNGYCNVCVIDSETQKNKIEAHLKESNIGFGNIYPSTISSQLGAKNHSKGHYGGNNAEILCKSIINLPLFPYMQKSEISKVVKAIKEAS